MKITRLEHFAPRKSYLDDIDMAEVHREIHSLVHMSQAVQFEVGSKIKAAALREKVLRDFNEDLAVVDERGWGIRTTMRLDGTSWSLFVQMELPSVVKAMANSRRHPRKRKED